MSLPSTRKNRSYALRPLLSHFPTGILTRPMFVLCAFAMQHVMVGGGDQLYCDPLTKEPEIAPWINESDNAKKIAAPLTAEMETALHRFFFNW